MIMKLRKYIFLFFVVFLVFQANAQFSPKIGGAATFLRFMKSETYFVLTGNARIDSAFRSAVNEYWDITPSVFVSQDSFKLFTRDRDKSFVYFNNLKILGTGKPIRALCLVNGGYEGMATYLNNTMAYISIDNEGYEANSPEIIYRMGHLIYQLQEAVDIVNGSNMADKTELAVRNKMQQYYNSRSIELQEKTLLVDKRYLSQKIVSEAEFVNLYKFGLSFVHKEEIEKAIMEKDETKAYLVSALNLYKINTVSDCATGRILYTEFEEEHPITKDFTKTFDRDDIILLNAYVRIAK